jgi:hypothetical protein
MPRSGCGDGSITWLPARETLRKPLLQSSTCYPAKRALAHRRYPPRALRHGLGEARLPSLG